MQHDASSPMIGIVGDRDPAYPTHLATEAALGHVPCPPRFAWLPTEDVDETRLSAFDGLLVAPGSPYRSMDGALGAIRFARQRGLPLLGTCGGFQHVVVEFARDVLGIAGADHEETNPAAPQLAVTALACSLAGQEHAVDLVPGTRLAALYDAARAVEPFFCGYGLNPDLRPRLERAGMVVGATDEDGQVRALELPAHPFFVATLYVPQARSRPGRPHPVVAALVGAARRAPVT